MTKLSMTIDFTPNVLLLGFLWAASPTAPAQFDVRAMLADLPLLIRRVPDGSLRLRPSRCLNPPIACVDLVSPAKAEARLRCTGRDQLN